jgi:hypothetical protein
MLEEAGRLRSQRLLGFAGGEGFAFAIAFSTWIKNPGATALKVHKRENFLGSDLEFFTIF